MHCSHCGEAVEKGSRFCRHCGTSAVHPDAAGIALAAPEPEPSRPVRTNQIIGMGLAAVLLFALLSVSQWRPTAGEGIADEALGEDIDASFDRAIANLDAASSGGTTEAPKADENWEYSSDTDKVRGGTSFFATAISSNSIQQQQPYDTDTRMRMTLRKSPAYGTDVILVISSGQMMCPSYDGCSGRISFDGGPAQRLQFNGPEDNSNDTVFVVGAQSFIAKLKKAKRVVIEKTLYQAGNPQFEFSVYGLKWEQ